MERPESAAAADTGKTGSCIRSAGPVSSIIVCVTNSRFDYGPVGLQWRHRGSCHREQGRYPTMVKWIGPCIPRGNVSHAPLGRVRAVTFSMVGTPVCPMRHLRSRILRRPPVENRPYKIAHSASLFLFVTIKPREQSGPSLFLFADSEGWRQQRGVPGMTLGTQTWVPRSIQAPLKGPTEVLMEFTHWAKFGP